MKIKKVSIGGEAFYPATIASAVKDANFKNSDTSYMTQGEINTKFNSSITTLEGKFDTDGKLLQSKLPTLPIATTTTLGAILSTDFPSNLPSGYTARVYNVHVDSSTGKAQVYVPWSDTSYTLSGSGSTISLKSGTTAAGSYTIPTATSSTLGLVSVGSTLTVSGGTINVPSAGTALGVVKSGVTPTDTEAAKFIAAYIKDGIVYYDRDHWKEELFATADSGKDETGKIKSEYLPSYVDDVLEYDKKADFPETGKSDKIYVDLSATYDNTYRWSGSAYVNIAQSKMPSAATASSLGLVSVPAGSGLSITSAGALSNAGVTAIASGTTKGAISVTTGTTTSSVSVYGLGSMAYETAANYQKQIAKTGATNKPVYFSAAGTVAACGFTVDKDVPSDAVFTDTTYALSGSGVSISLKDSNATAAGSYTIPTASTSLGVVKTTSTVTSATGYTAVPIISGVPYYKNDNTTYSASKTAATTAAADKLTLTPSSGTATTLTLSVAGTGSTTSDGTYGVVKTTSSVTAIPENANYAPCPIVGGVPYYKNDNTNTTYGVASTTNLGLVKVSSVITDTANYTACGVVSGTGVIYANVAAIAVADTNDYADLF